MENGGGGGRWKMVEGVGGGVMEVRKIKSGGKGGKR